MNELTGAIQEASSILLLLSNDASDKDFLAALQLQKMAPEKTFLVAPEEKEHAWGMAPSKKEFAITIDTTRAPVDELRYEKNGETLVVYLSHRNQFPRDAVSMGEHIPQVDLIISTGFVNRKDAERAIDALAQKPGARHIWLDEGQTPGVPIQKEHKKLLPQSAALLGRLMVRSREDHDLGILWAFVTKEDFVKTNSHPRDLSEILESFSAISSLPRVTAVFWQHIENSHTEGMLWSSDNEVLASVAEEQNASYLGGRELPLGPYSDFTEAEIQTRKLLRRAL